jgi:predicted PolB exonuclease-like 3'-5' exonuclease
MIEVKKISSGSFQVRVHGGTETVHTVSLSDDYYHKLTRGRETEERLIERSFEFLLRHEPNTAILKSFDLSVINRYFPDFEKEIGGNLGET